MATTTVAGSSLAISVDTPASHDVVGYSALTFTEVGGIEKIGTAGAVHAKVDFQPLKGSVQKRKGSPDYGTLAPSLAHDDTDPGQSILRTASDDATSKLYAFRVTYPTGAVRYFRGRVFGYPETVDGAETILMAAPTVEISTRVVKADPGAPIPAPSFSSDPAISGTPMPGQPLSSLTFTDGVVANGSVTSRSYLLAGAPVALSYVLQASDVGKSLIFRNGATGPGGTAQADSTPKAVANAAPPAATPYTPTSTAAGLPALPSTSPIGA